MVIEMTIFIIILILFFRFLFSENINKLLLIGVIFFITLIDFGKSASQISLINYFLMIYMLLELYTVKIASFILVLIYLFYSRFIFVLYGKYQLYLFLVTVIFFCFLLEKKRKKQDDMESKEILYKRSKQLGVNYKFSLKVQKILDREKILELLLETLGAKENLAFDRVIFFEYTANEFYSLKSKGYLTRERANKNLQYQLKTEKTNPNLEEEVWEKIKNFKVENSIDNVFGRIYYAKKTIVVREIDHKDEVQLFLKKRIKAKEFALLPVLENNEIVGVVYLDYIDGKKLEYEELDNAMLIINQASMAISNSKLYKNIKLDSVTDSLTGLYNKRFLDERFNAFKETSIEKGLKMSTILIDIDYFKIYNDNNGHIKGNELLEKISKLFLQEVRLRDIVTRFGGEEFCIILLEADMDKAVSTAERIRERIASEYFENQESQPGGNLTISLGVYEYNNEETMEEFLEKADMALYTAKDKGRNKVEVYRGDSL